MDSREDRLWGAQPGFIRIPEHSSIETEASRVAAYKGLGLPPLSPPGHEVLQPSHCI